MKSWKLEIRIRIFPFFSFLNFLLLLKSLNFHALKFQLYHEHWAVHVRCEVNLCFYCFQTKMFLHLNIRFRIFSVFFPLIIYSPFSRSLEVPLLSSQVFDAVWVCDMRYERMAGIRVVPHARCMCGVYIHLHCQLLSPSHQLSSLEQPGCHVETEDRMINQHILFYRQLGCLAFRLR